MTQLASRRNAKRKATITVRVPGPLLASLKRDAARSGVTVNALILRCALERAQLDLLTDKVFRALDGMESNPRQAAAFRT